MVWNNEIHLNKSYPNLINQIWEIISTSKNKIISHVNTTMVLTYWNIWKYIVEYEQWWKDRAEYWENIIEKLSVDLTKKYWKWFSYRNLQQIKKFYILYPNLQTVSAQFQNLSWSHYVFLMGIKEEDKRNFYMIESIENNWSLRELKRQFDTSLYHRLALSKDKKWIIELSKKWNIITKPEDFIKDPMILEFLWLEEKSKYSENDLEQAIIDNLQYFLLELGKWFSFVARQKRITIEENHYFIDLVFYNRFLRCFVLVDLKIWKLTHGDIWQMQMYVNMYDRTIRLKDKENPTIWLLLCEKNDKVVVEYTLPEWNNQIFSSEYQLYLPSKEEIQKYLDEHLNNLHFAIPFHNLSDLGGVVH